MNLGSDIDGYDQPTIINYKVLETSKYYGELNSEDKPDGRGVRIWEDGVIYVGYWSDGKEKPGHYLKYNNNGEF